MLTANLQLICGGSVNLLGDAHDFFFRLSSGRGQSVGGTTTHQMALGGLPTGRIHLSM
jgi:hypothetical protein